MLQEACKKEGEMSEDEVTTAEEDRIQKEDR